MLRRSPTQIRMGNLLSFVAVLIGLVLLHTILFHYLMAREGREYSWMTGFYWTLTVMSTLGFGDITFQTDVGRLFSTVVLLSGVVFLLVLLPFTFIEFFYAPWMQAQAAARAPKVLPEKTSGHIILTTFDIVTNALIERLNLYHYSYVLLQSNLDDALRLHDLDYDVMVGDLDNPETYRRSRAEQAALVVSTASDMVNTNVAFTVREISETVPIITTANAAASVDILELAGSSHVLQFGEMLGQALARRVIGGSTLAHVIGQFDDLLIAEAVVGESDIAGQTLSQSRLRERLGITVLGLWERGRFEEAHPNTRISKGMVLVLAGAAEHIQQYNNLFLDAPKVDTPIIIIGGGRVGRATGKSLVERSLDYRIVEQMPERIRDPEKYVLGNAAELSVLKEAGIMTAPAVVITTHDDDTNIYLTIYCRRLRPDMQIISRATLERNIATLHRAGADFVMSYASMGASAIVNLLNRDSLLMVAEGLVVFSFDLPARLVGKSLAESGIREETNCNVVALQQNDKTIINPDPFKPLAAGTELILVGTVEAEARFLHLYAD